LDSKRFFGFEIKGKLMKKFLVTQVKSEIGCTESQRATLKALGLKGREKRIVIVDNPANRGQLKKVQHLVRIEVQR
jgi:large subunit ribosomal protein L30